MAELMAYLQLIRPNGQTVEIFNGARTLSHLRAGRAADAWQLTPDNRNWDGAEPWPINQGDYEIDSTLTDGTANPDPWWDPQDPRTTEVAGFLIDPPGPSTGFVIEPAYSTQRVSAQGVPDLQGSITGTVVTRTRGGERSFVENLLRTLDECCDACDGVTARVLADIPCETDLVPLIDEFGNLTNPSTDPGAPPAPADYCDENPPVLTPYAATLPNLIEDGIRDIPGVRFRSFDPIFDQPVFPGCVGQRYRLTFDIRSSTWYGRPVPVCSIGGPGAWPECGELSMPFRRCSGTSTSAIECGPTRPFARRQTQLSSSRWIQPRCFRRLVCLTPPQPQSVTTRLLATLTNGSGTVHNAALRVWRAIEGYPAPDTKLGADIYNNIEPVWSARVPVLRPHEELRLDGRTGTVTLHCQTGETVTGGGLVEGPSGSAWFPPAFSCDDRHWIALDLSADARSQGNNDIAARFELAREEIIA